MVQIVSAHNKAVFLIAALTAWAADPSAAQTPLSGAEFQSYATGKTLIFKQNGMAYGAEQYFEGGRVKWAFSEDECVDGVWYEAGDNICFEYETGDGPQCWQFFREAGGLRAVFSGESGTELYEAQQSTAPLACLGPRIGA